MLDTPEGTVLYQDTSGHWSGILQTLSHDLRPDVAILAAAGRGNVDGEPIQGSLAEFVARQAWLVKAPKVVLSHHDDWLPGFSVATDVEPIRELLARWVPRHRARRARLPRRSRAVRLNRGSRRASSASIPASS